MKKYKNSTVIVFLIVMMTFLASCGNNKKNGATAEQISTDLDENLYLSMNNFMIKSIDIIKRQTNYDNKEDIIYVTVCKENDYFRVTENYVMHYALYNEGWMLENIDAYYDDGNGYGETEIIRYPTEDELINDIKKIYPTYSFKFSDFDTVGDCKIERISCSEDKMESTWSYSYEYEYFTYIIYLNLYYYQSQNYSLDPQACISDHEYCFKDNITGKWVTASEQFNHLNVISIEITKESPYSVSIVRTEDTSEYIDEYEADLKPSTIYTNSLYEDPASLILGPIFNDYAVVLFPDGMRFCNVKSYGGEYEDLMFNIVREDENMVSNEVLEETKHKVEMKLKSNEVESARKTIEKELIKFPGNKELIDLYRLIQDCYPVSLDYGFLSENDFSGMFVTPDKEVFSYNGYDNVGNYIENGITLRTGGFYDFNDIMYYTFSLGKNYSHFTGTLAGSSWWHQNKYDTDFYETTFYILGDERELLSWDFNEDSGPITFDFDVTGVNELKIGVKVGPYPVYLVLEDATLYKQYINSTKFWENFADSSVNVNGVAPMQTSRDDESYLDDVLPVISKENLKFDVSSGMEVATIFNVAYVDGLITPGVYNDLPSTMQKYSPLPDSKCTPGQNDWVITVGDDYGVDIITLNGFIIWPDSSDYEENIKSLFTLE